MTQTTIRLHELEQLRRLRELREETARQSCEARREARDACQATLDDTRLRLESLRRQCVDLAQWVGGAGASSMAQLGPFASARRQLLDNACERTEYALIDDEAVLAEAEEELTRAQAHWVKACAMTQSIQRLVARARLGLAREAELRAEREADPIRMPIRLEPAMHGHHGAPR